jgi:hypothetical protein
MLERGVLAGDCYIVLGGNPFLVKSLSSMFLFLDLIIYGLMLNYISSGQGSSSPSPGHEEAQLFP